MKMTVMTGAMTLIHAPCAWTGMLLSIIQANRSLITGGVMGWRTHTGIAAVARALFTAISMKNSWIVFPIGRYRRCTIRPVMMPMATGCQFQVDRYVLSQAGSATDRCRT